MFEFIKAVLIPAVKDDVKKRCVKAIEVTLYGKRISIF